MTNLLNQMKGDFMLPKGFPIEQLSGKKNKNKKTNQSGLQLKI